MFDQLINSVLTLGTHLLPFTTVKVWQNAGVLRFGKYNRTIGPGLHWKIPLVDEIVVEDVVMTTLRLQPQTLTTKDGKSVVVTAVVKYHIEDVRPYIEGVNDQKDALLDTTAAAVAEAVRSMTFEELVERPPSKRVAEALRRQVRRYGFKIEGVTFTDLGQIRSLRLITHSAPELV